MYEKFKARAVGVGAEVHRLSTRNAAVDFILQFLRSEGVADASGCYALWADSPFLAGVDKKTLRELPGLGFQVTRALASHAKVGISQMDWALTDTGSLVQDQSAVEQRLVSSLPEIHVALVPTGNILDGKEPHDSCHLKRTPRVSTTKAPHLKRRGAFRLHPVPEGHQSHNGGIDHGRKVI